MITRILPKLFRQLFSGSYTNTFPTVNMPPSLTDALENPGILTPPLLVGERFRGRVDLNRAKCIGCRLCIKYCPANAIESQPEEKKVIIYNDRCCFCAQCVEVCPPKCLSMSGEFLTSTYSRKESIVTDSAL